MIRWSTSTLFSIIAGMVLGTGCVSSRLSQDPFTQVVRYPFKKLDASLTRLSDSLAHHTAHTSSAVLQRQGYYHHYGFLKDVPVQELTLTNLVYLPQFKAVPVIRLTYTPPREILEREEPYLLLRLFSENRSREREMVPNEIMRIYLTGLSQEKMADGRVTYSYDFPRERRHPDEYVLPAGRYRYEWWDEMPPNEKENRVQGIMSAIAPPLSFIFFTESPLLEGSFEVR